VRLLLPAIQALEYQPFGIAAERWVRVSPNKRHLGITEWAGMAMKLERSDRHVILPNEILLQRWRRRATLIAKPNLLSF
jgi:hypothetical protein